VVKAQCFDWFAASLPVSRGPGLTVEN